MKKINLVLTICMFHLYVNGQQLASLKQSKDFLQNFFLYVDHLPKITFPFGSNGLLITFPASWNYANPLVSNDTARKNFEDQVKKMDQAFYTETDLSAGIILKIPYRKSRFLFPSDFPPSIVKYDTSDLEVKMLGRLIEKKYSLVAIAFSQNIICNKCEYPEKLEHLFLISINQKKEIIDNLSIAFVKGGDLGRFRRYCYIDRHKTIYLKEFSSDEVSDSYLRNALFKIGSNGKFVKRNSKRKRS